MRLLRDFADSNSINVQLALCCEFASLHFAGATEADAVKYVQQVRKISSFLFF